MLIDILVGTMLILCLVISSAALWPPRRHGHHRMHFHHRHG
jgi:hypothetical protein